MVASPVDHRSAPVVAPKAYSPTAPDADLRQWDREHVLHPWRVQGGEPTFIVRAEGSRFWDDTGREYLDFTSQLVYANLGHAPPRLVEAAADQMATAPAIASMFATAPKARLGRLLAEITPGDLNRTFFSTSGAEANEAAIKIARQVTGRTTIVTRYRSYHGSTLGAAVVSQDPRTWSSQGSAVAAVPALDPYCYRCPFGKTFPSCELQCAQHIEDVIELNGGSAHVAAVIIEPVTGANGVIVPPPGYMQRVRETCDRQGVLLIADEVMVGFGRTGEWFACDHWGVTPDILALSKGLTGGMLPLGATVVREPIAQAFDTMPLLHGHTASGNTTACAVGVAAITEYREQNLIERSRTQGRYLLERCRWLSDRHPCVGDVRGLGLFAGLELVRDRTTREPLSAWPQRFPVTDSPIAKVLAACRMEGLFLMSAHPSVLHLAPPLIITTEEIDHAITILDRALSIADGFVRPGAVS